jgi:uncharacterized protein (DUF1697 family)
MASKQTLSTYAALLRGINVGGNNMIAMKDLARMFTEHGCCEVTTYIQSGNVLFKATSTGAVRAANQVASQLADRWGHPIPVVLRSAEELRIVACSNPFVAAGVDPEKLHIAFLAQLPSTDRVASLDANRSPPDVFQVQGKEIYLHLVHGVARTRLTNAWFDVALATTSTMRNWRTVVRLMEMTGG